ncbi:MAG: hypothetical protein IJ341_02370 [Bacteroidales bacterium]|nr:hypothetical protein [Bacteroidales bacterium]
MKCFECPLCVPDPYDITSDYDCYCLITRDFTDIESGCKRTNEFILSQNVDKLKDEWAKEEAEKWDEFAKHYEDENNIKEN